MHPLALFGSLLVHGFVVVALMVSLPSTPTQLDFGDAWTVDLVTLDEMTDELRAVPAPASPLPELQATRRPDPTPPDTPPTPDPPGAPPAPVATAPTPAPEPTPQPAPAPPQPVVEPEPAPAPEPAPTVTAAEPAPPAPEPTPTPAPEPTPPATATPAPEPAPQVAQEVAPEPAAAEAGPVTVAGTPRRRPDTPAAVAQATPPPATSQQRGTPQPSPDARPQPREEPDPLDALLQSVEQIDRRLQAETARDTTGRTDVAAGGEGSDQRVQQLGRLIYDQIIGCWTVPAGLEGLRQVGPVEIRTEFGPGGDVVRATVENQARLQTDRVFRSVAESAERAIRSCTPLRGMPADLYQQWRLTILVFDPTQITAGG